MDSVIIGVSGFIGSALAQHLSGKGHRVLGLDVVPPARPLPTDVNFRTCDVRNGDIEVTTAADVVFYLAQCSDYRGGASQELFEINTRGAIRAYYAAERAGARLFVYASTGNVYGPAFSPLAEDAPVRRDQPYALSKLLVEEWLAVCQTQTQAACVRLFGVFGPGQRAMLPVILRQRIESGTAIRIERNPHDERDDDGLRISFCFVEDAVRVLEMLAARAIAGKDTPRVLNVAGAEPISIRTFAETMGAALGRRPRFESPETARQFDLIADISRMQSLIDFPLTPFEEAIRRTVA